MDEQNKPASDSQLEQRLSRLYQTPSPDPDFARRLEVQLDKRASQMGASMPSARRSSWWDALGNAARWGWGLAGMALLVVVIVFAVRLLPGGPSALPQVVPDQPIATTPTPITQATPTHLANATPTSPQQAEAQVTAAVPGATNYTVVEGDTLLSIAEKFGVPVASIFELNNLQTGDVLYPGRELLIPLYRVATGDTCASIAFAFGITVEALVQANDLSVDCANLVDGQELRIPLLTPTPIPATPQAYVIARNAQVNLRLGPGTQYEVVGLLDIGDKLLKKGDVTPDGWLPVEFPPGSGETAYVWVELVIVMDPTAAETGVPAPADWVRASNPRTQDDKLLVDVCFNLLDDGDWMVRDAILRIDQPGGSLEIPYDSSTLISIRPFTSDSEGAHTGERCDVLEFPLEPGAVPANPVLSVLSLQAYPREGQDCQLYIERVQPLLTARDTGILIACQQVPYAAGNVTILSKPDEISLEAAQAAVYQAFQDIIALRGPWDFDFTEMLAPESAVPDLLEQQPLLAELRALNLLRSKTVLTTPGWVHLQYRQINQESGGILPDGKEIPAEFRMDEWYELNEAGQIVRSVARMLDLAGEPLQAAIVQDNFVTNTTFEETQPQEVFYLQPLDFGFTGLAENALKTNKTFSKQALYFEGSYVGDQYVIQDEQVRWESVYEPATGKQLNFITWQVIPEGLKFISSVVIEVLENVSEPPPEVLAFFEQ